MSASLFIIRLLEGVRIGKCRQCEASLGKLSRRWKCIQFELEKLRGDHLPCNADIGDRRLLAHRERLGRAP